MVLDTLLKLALAIGALTEAKVTVIYGGDAIDKIVVEEDGYGYATFASSWFESEGQLGPVVSALIDVIEAGNLARVPYPALDIALEVVQTLDCFDYPRQQLGVQLADLEA